MCYSNQHRFLRSRKAIHEICLYLQRSQRQLQRLDSSWFGFFTQRFNPKPKYPSTNSSQTWFTSCSRAIRVSTASAPYFFLKSIPNFVYPTNFWKRPKLRHFIFYTISYYGIFLIQKNRFLILSYYIIYSLLQYLCILYYDTTIIKEYQTLYFLYTYL